MCYSSKLAHSIQWPHRKTKGKLVECTLNKGNNTNKVDLHRFHAKCPKIDGESLTDLWPRASALTDSMGKWALSSPVIIWSFITIRRCLSDHSQGKQLISYRSTPPGGQCKGSHGQRGPKGFISTEIFHKWGIKLNQGYSEASSPFGSGNFSCHIRFQTTLLMLEMQLRPRAQNIFLHTLLTASNKWGNTPPPLSTATASLFKPLQDTNKSLPAKDSVCC